MFFRTPSWIPRFDPPSSSFNTKPPTYGEVTNVIKRMKSSGYPCPLDQISILVFKHCPHLRSYLTAVLEQVWESGKIPEVWKKATTILIHKKETCEDPANFRPITLESVPLKIFTSLIRNKMFSFLSENKYVEHEVQKGFTPKVSGTFEHTSQMAYTYLRNKRMRRCGVPPPPPPPTNNFRKTSVTPTNYISSEREFIGESESSKILGKYFGFAIL